MRQRGGAFFPLRTSLPLQLSGHLYFPWHPRLPPSPNVRPLTKRLIRHPAVTCHSLLWTSHVTSPLFLSLSLCLSFCYSLARSVSSLTLTLTPPPNSPLMCTVWGMVHEQRHSVSHPESWTKTRTYREVFTGCVTLTRRSPTSSSPPPWQFFAKCYRVVFTPPRSTCFIHTNRR